MFVVANRNPNGSLANNTTTESTSARAEIVFGRLFNTESMITSPINLSVRYVEEILKVEGVEAAVPVVNDPYRRTGEVGIEYIEGVDWVPYAAINKLTIKSGRPFERFNEVVIDETKARENRDQRGG